MARRPGSDGPGEGGEAALAAEVFRGLDFLGPGAPEETLEMAREADLGRRSSVVELGAGTGRTACLLARELGCRVALTDVDAAALRRARARVKREGLAELVSVTRADLAALPAPFEPGSFDAAFAESALHAVGLAAGLRAVRSLIRPEGALAFTELMWVKPPPPSVRGFWDRVRPGNPVLPMQEVIIAVGDAGFETGVAWRLPPAAWDRYYGPLRANVEGLRAAGRAGLLLDLLELEMRLHYEEGGREALACVAVVARRTE